MTKLTFMAVRANQSPDHEVLTFAAPAADETESEAPKRRSRARAEAPAKAEPKAAPKAAPPAPVATVPAANRARTPSSASGTISPPSCCAPRLARRRRNS